MVANPAMAGEIRLSGMKRGAWGNVAYGGNVNPPRNRKGGSGNPPPKGKRAPALSRPPIADPQLLETLLMSSALQFFTYNTTQDILIKGLFAFTKILL